MFVNVKLLQLYHLFVILDKSLLYHDIIDALLRFMFIF